MKRLILVVCALLIATAACADVIIQQDFEGVGMMTDFVGNNMPDSLRSRAGSEFTPSYGFSFTAVYEFNSDKDAPVHYHAGLTGGIDGPGFTALLTGGLTTEVAQFGDFVLDLRADLRLGPCLSIANTIIPIAQTDVMLNFAKAGRKGLYAGIGLADHFQIMTMEAPSLDDAHLINYAGLIFAAGWRF